MREDPAHTKPQKMHVFLYGIAQALKPSTEHTAEESNIIESEAVIAFAALIACVWPIFSAVKLALGDTAVL